MSRYLRLSKDQYGISGLIPLTAGDDWTITARVVSLVGGVELDQNIAGATVSGFFPAASGGFLQGTCVILDSTCGQIQLGLPQNVSSGALLSDQGIAPYVTLQDSLGLHTLYPYDLPLQIVPRGTPQF